LCETDSTYAQKRLMLTWSFDIIGRADDYYHPVFDFCTPEGGPKKQGESLGSILFGDRIYTSPYEV
jgi:hypothetical protein